MDTSSLLIFGTFGMIVLTAVATVNWRVSICAAMITVLFEGALRKWVLISASDLIYFLKDGLLLGAYIRFFRENPVPLAAQWPTIPVSTLGACCIFVALSTLNPNTGSLMAAVLGLKGYLFYVPLFFIIPHLFRSKREIVIGLSCYALLAIPICLLGFIQYRSDGFSVINTYAAGISEYGASTFGVSDRVRVSGTFSYLSGHTTFVVVFFGLAIALICAEKNPFRAILMFVALPCIVANAFMSGSRACVLSIGLIEIGFFASISKHDRLRKSVVVMLISFGIIAISVIFFFLDSFENLMARAQGAGDSTYGRLVESPLEQLTLAFERGGIFGCGIGTTSPAVESLRVKFQINQPEYHPGYYDGELGQVLAELGLSGFVVWYLFRLSIILVLISSYRSTNDITLKSIVLVAILINLPYLIISLVLNHVACVLIWAVSGLGLIPLLHSGSPTRRSDFN